MQGDRFMNEKLTIEQFREIKYQLLEVLRQTEEYFDKNDDINSEEAEKEFFKKYTDIEKNLLNYDLSDIPFEEWKNIEIISDDSYIADFSKTKANIDFELVEFYGPVNFKGCNIRNLSKISNKLDPKNFDDKTIQENNHLFLSNLFSEEFKEKYYKNILNIEDIINLPFEQLEELKQKKVANHFEFNNLNELMYETLGLDKLIDLYKYSKEVYELVNTLVRRISVFTYHGDLEHSMSFNTFIEQIRNANIDEMKNVCYEYLKSNLLTSKYSKIEIEKLPEIFVRENSDILLTDSSIPSELRERYYSRNLTLDDVINNIDLFENIPVEYYLDYKYGNFDSLSETLGYGNLQKIIKKYPIVIKHIVEKDKLYYFSKCLNQNPNIEENFKQAIKKYVFIREGLEEFSIIPEWLEPLNFSFVKRLETKEDLLNYNFDVVVVDKKQRILLDELGIENIKRFERETGFFSHKQNTYSRDLEMFNAFSQYLYMNRDTLLRQNINFKDGSLSYDEFVEKIANCLDVMRRNNLFTDYPDYDWMKGEFRNRHPEIFIDENATDELKNAFYKNKIDPGFLFNHKEYIPYLVDKNLINTIKADMKLSIPGMYNEKGNVMLRQLDFTQEYVSRYGNEKFLKLVSKYGSVLSNIEILCFNKEIEDENLIEVVLREAIYKKILNSKDVEYSYLYNVSEFVLEHPDIFVNFDKLNISEEKHKKLVKDFYSGNISFETIRQTPELINLLKDKNLQFIFRKKNQGIMSRSRWQNSSSILKQNSDLNLLEAYGNEKFLELCSSYGRYMDGAGNDLQENRVIFKDGKYIDLETKNIISFEEIKKRIEDSIIEQSFLGNISYQPEDAPAFLKEKHPELFLDEDAPQELKQYFYNYANNYPLTFQLLNNHKEWLPYLKNKSISTSLLSRSYLKNDMIEFFEVFGEEKAIKLGINRAETVNGMLELHQVDLMKAWYDKTGQKFIPDFVVMQNFKIEEADKFLLAGANWSSLMKIKNFADNQDARDAMLKLAYSFGVFDQDQIGFKKLQTLLTDLPRHISSNYSHIMSSLSSLEFLIPLASKGNTNVENPQGYNEYIQLKDTLKNEGFVIDNNKELFEQLYRKNEDGSYTLTINPQSFPKSSALIRKLLEMYPDAPIITPNRAHHLFGRFKLQYDKEFREFLLTNLDEIIENPEKAGYISAIQRNFDDIKIFYKNINLTLDSAISFVRVNKFENINVGNELAADVISKLEKYTEEDFDVLQQIYNYSKQRTFSSIPRVEKTIGKYSYEMLRLDDPLAMVIGTLTDCCQELGNCAEVCMEHSMVDKNGRIFVVRDETGAIVAQSWVWRNKNVLCFDNIEVPDQQMWDHGVQRGYEDSGIRNEFTDEVLEVYKQAAQDLMLKDEQVFKELLESGKITSEQYEGLRLRKVTVGLGFSNIKGSFKTLDVDKNISRPLAFEEPIKLSRGLYTSDSNTQYILEDSRDYVSYNLETLPVHNDSYIEYDDSNFTEKHLLSLEKLELVTKEDSQNLETSLSDYADKSHLVTEISKNYGLRQDTTRIIMNPNFAIIYDVTDNKLRIGDLLYNIKVDNGLQQLDISNVVMIQIRLALEQIGKNKEIDISLLGEEQKEMYFKIMSISDEIDKERGVGYAR